MRRVKQTNETEAAFCQPIPRLFNQKMAASYFSISERNFENWWRSGQLPAPVRIGRRILWDRKILDEWADELSGVGFEINDFGDYSPSEMRRREERSRKLKFR